MNSTRLEGASALEKLTGNVTTQSALTVFAAWVATNVTDGPTLAATLGTPLLAPLASAFAANRQQARVAKALDEIAAELDGVKEQVRQMSDAQYKLLNEIVLAVLHTTEDAKIAYLRRAISGTLEMESLESQKAIHLSRIFRDISAQETAFLLANFKYECVEIMERLFPDNDERRLAVKRDSKDALIVAGLLSLGILAPGEREYAGIGCLNYTDIAAPFIAIVKGSDGDASPL